MSFEGGILDGARPVIVRLRTVFNARRQGRASPVLSRWTLMPKSGSRQTPRTLSLLPPRPAHGLAEQLPTALRGSRHLVSCFCNVDASPVRRSQRSSDYTAALKTLGTHWPTWHSCGAQTKCRFARTRRLAGEATPRWYYVIQQTESTVIATTTHRVPDRPARLSLSCATNGHPRGNRSLAGEALLAAIIHTASPQECFVGDTVMSAPDETVIFAFASSSTLEPIFSKILPGRRGHTGSSIHAAFAQKC
ncbi:hypothetical protein BDZ89DRAFT_1147957 [Hymenopellis radicata]|nr:hypothetical protein BDZ89DRAFT_1147957 [Hymenopellis radicata]